MARILVVEDFDMMRETIRELLSPLHEILEAENGKQALKVIAQNRPDLVVTDYHMPEMNGFRLARAIKGDPELASIPVILMSSEPSAAMLAREAGCDAFLNKDSLGELSGAIERLLPK